MVVRGRDRVAEVDDFDNLKYAPELGESGDSALLPSYPRSDDKKGGEVPGVTWSEWCPY